MKKFSLKPVVFLVAALVLVAWLGLHDAAAVVPNTTQAVAVNMSGGPASFQTTKPAVGPQVAMSQDGRYLFFSSYADDLVTDPAATMTSKHKIFVKDRLTNTISLTALNASGAPANNAGQPTGLHMVSATGRYIMYTSDANNMTNDSYLTYGSYHLFLYDREQGTTVMVDKNSTGGYQRSDSSVTDASVSADGNFVAFKYKSTVATNIISSPTLSPNVDYIFLKNMKTGELKLISKATDGSAANGTSYSVRMDCNGDYLAFDSVATNMVATGVSGYRDIYLMNMQTNELKNLTSAANSNSYLEDMSCNGQQVSLSSYATALGSASTSNGKQNVFLYNRITNGFKVISLTNTGGQSNGQSSQSSVSDDGKYVVFMSGSTNLVSTTVTNAHIYLRNTEANTTQLLDASSSGVPGNGQSVSAPNITHDGKYVSYGSTSQNIVPGYYFYANNSYYLYPFVTRTDSSQDY